MSIYSDLKEAIKLLDDMKDLKSKVSKLEDETMKLRERVAYLEAREDAIVLSAKEAVREALREANSEVPKKSLTESSQNTHRAISAMWTAKPHPFWQFRCAGKMF